MARRIMYFLVLLVFAWCVMAMVHEAGHVICGYACGGILQDADVLPWHLPYSIFQPDPYPLVTLWGGPLLGVILPFALASVIRKDWSWFIASFCMLANGLYIATAWGSNDQYLDTPKLLQHGAHPLSIAVYCLLTIGIGYQEFRRQCMRALTVPESESGL